MASTAIATVVLPVGIYPRAPFSNAAIIESVPSRSDKTITGSDRSVVVSEAIVSSGPCPLEPST
jgi:hypothetical protein